MQRLTHKKVRESEDTVYVEINDQTFYVFHKAQMDEMLSWSWMKNEKDNFVWITDDLYLYTDFSRNQLYKAIDIGTFDWAVPQDWFDSHLEEIKSHSGVVWYYADRDYFGKPYYDDMARERLKGMILQAIKDNS